MKITRTTKRLLSLSFLNVTLSYHDGHRWIEFNEDTNSEHTSLIESLKQYNIYANNKVYGNIIDSLNFIDFLLKKVDRCSLEEMFDSWNDLGFEYTEFEDLCNHGSETTEYFETRISKN